MFFSSACIAGGHSAIVDEKPFALPSLSKTQEKLKNLNVPQISWQRWLHFVEENYDNFLLILVGKNVFREIQRIRLQRSPHQCIRRAFEETSMLSEVPCLFHSCTFHPNLWLHCSQEWNKGLPWVNLWEVAKINYFLSLPIFILSFDTAVSMSHL